MSWPWESLNFALCAYSVLSIHATSSLVSLVGLDRLHACASVGLGQENVSIHMYIYPKLSFNFIQNNCCGTCWGYVGDMGTTSKPDSFSALCD